MMNMNIYEIEERAILQCTADDAHRNIDMNPEFAMHGGLGDNM